MEIMNDKLKDTSGRLRAQSALFVSATREAGGSFVSRTRQAGEDFLSQTREASGELVSHTVQAQRELIESVQEEAEEWLEYFRTEGAKLKLDQLPRLRAPLEGEDMKLPNVREVEKRILTGIESALQVIEVRVHSRIQTLDERALPGDTSSKKNGDKKNGRSKRGAVEAQVSSAAPIPGYDKLTARDLATKVQRLDVKKVEAVLAYEEDNKNRATVVNAARARLES